MPLKIYNSLTNQKEEFKPLQNGIVKMYVCGPTVYDEPHIGHIRSAYVFEVIRKYLKYLNYKVIFVRNVTDVDDKIIEKAQTLHQENLIDSVKEISEKYLDDYRQELAAHGIKIDQPDVIEPLATLHISAMVRLIERLMQKGFAYKSDDGDVYFEVDKFTDYGKLSGQKKESMLGGIRFEPNEKKKNPLDFALWKKSKPEEPAWDGPKNVPRGRPGWHIECSAMSMQYLGDTFDIHGGGIDLIFPHHENEIAQSEAATGQPFARYWLHHGLVTRDGQKMSKSLHNFSKSSIRDIPYQQEKRAEEYKILYLSTHYRAPLDFTEEKIQMAKSIFDHFNNFFEENSRIVRGKGLMESSGEATRYKQSLTDAMDDDFNAPKALTIMYDMVKFARDTKQDGIRLVIERELKSFGSKVFGIFMAPSDEQSTLQLSNKLNLTEEIERLVRLREEAKKKKDYKSADALRKKLSDLNVTLKDTLDGKTAWRLN